MIIYPAIDIKDGKCVRLKQGKFDNITIYNDDPVEVAKSFEIQGAEFIHIVDLDGAKTGTGSNLEIIKKIVSTIKIPVQTGGGIRSMEDLKIRINTGVSRVIIGSNAVTNPDFVKNAVLEYGEKIAVGIDAKNGFVATHGWEKNSGIKAIEHALNMQSLGVKTIIYTDIATDGMLKGPNTPAMLQMARSVNMDIIASGGVSSIEDVALIKNTGVKGVIIGKALYENRLSLVGALNALK